jgi:hypothetical protein
MYRSQKTSLPVVVSFSQQSHHQIYHKTHSNSTLLDTICLYLNHQRHYLPTVLFGSLQKNLSQPKSNSDDDNHIHDNHENHNYE